MLAQPFNCSHFNTQVQCHSPVKHMSIPMDTQGAPGRALVQAAGSCRLCVTPKNHFLAIKKIYQTLRVRHVIADILEFVNVFIYMNIFQNKLFRVQYFVLNNSGTTVEKPHFGMPTDSSSMTTEDMGRYHIHLQQYLTSLMSPEQKSPVFPKEP